MKRLKEQPKKEKENSALFQGWPVVFKKKSTDLDPSTPEGSVPAGTTFYQPSCP